MRTHFNIRKLEKISPWNDNGTLPVGFCNPKEKALKDKERGIASYLKHPMRKIYKRTGKVLMVVAQPLMQFLPTSNNSQLSRNDSQILKNLDQ